MSKFISLFILALMFVWQSAFAVAPIPTNSISVEPLIAENDSPIKISALIYNPQKETITFTVEFKAGEISLGKQVASVAPLGAKTVSVAWKQPKMKTDISVMILSALDAQKKDNASLHGLVGSIVLGTEDVKAPSVISFGQGKIGIALSGFFDTIEAFRQKQAVYFAALRDEAKQSLDMQAKDDVIKKLSPIFSPPTTAPMIGDDATAPPDDLALTENDNPLQIYKASDSKHYGTLLLGTVAASFFGSMVFFYAVAIIMLLFLLRLLFKLIF